MYSEENLNTVEISKIVGCSDGSVGRLLNRYGVERHEKPHRSKLPDDQIKSVCEMYISGMTAIEIAEVFNTTDNTIAKYLRNNGINIREAKRRSIVNRHNYFENVDTPEKAYFLGWMVTDGSVVQSKSRPDRTKVISLSIHNTDRYIVEKFADELEAKEGSVKLESTRNHCYFRFSSEKMANDLAKYGVIPNKTYSAYLPKIDESLMPHLIRGIFDGNGSVTINQKHNGSISFAFYGTEELCTQTRDYLNIVCGIRKPPVSKSTCYHVWWGSRESAAEFYQYIYKDSDNLCLSRKRDKFKNFLFPDTKTPR